MSLNNPREVCSEEAKRRTLTKVAYEDYAVDQDVLNCWFYAWLWTLGLAIVLVAGHYLFDFGRYALHLWLTRH